MRYLSRVWRSANAFRSRAARLVCSIRQSSTVAACRSNPCWRILALMGTENFRSANMKPNPRPRYIYGEIVFIGVVAVVFASDRLACFAWNQRMLGFKGPGQPSPRLGDALNAGYGYLEVRCLGCDTPQTVALNIVRRPKKTAIHELERYMRCKDCSRVRGYPYKRSYLETLRLFG
jgi:hypothetical protein